MKDSGQKSWLVGGLVIEAQGLVLCGCDLGMASLIPPEHVCISAFVSFSAYSDILCVRVVSLTKLIVAHTV